MLPRMLAVLVPAIAVGRAAQPAPGLAAPFTDHAVLQANRPVPIWGSAGPGEHVVVSFAGRKAGAWAGPDGRWMAILGPLAANGSGSDLVVAGLSPRILRDVVVGEVWLCAGCGLQPEAEGREPDEALVRCFRGSARNPGPGAPAASWQPLSSASRERGTVGGAFASSLASRLREPVGIVLCEAADAPIEEWMSPDAAGAGAGAGASRQFEDLVDPVLPYAVRGILWSQGPADDEDAGPYAKRFPRLVASWRAHLGEGDVPFLWLQLGPGPGKGRRPLLREAQQRALALPSSGQAVSIDTSQPSELGRRLALIAKARVYSVPESFAGPEFEDAEPEGAVMRVRFRGAEDGLTAAGGPLRSFELAGADRVFHAAHASISGQAVLVTAPQVARPVAVRYAWRDAPDANLFGGSGLPAAPFRSDAW